MGRVSKHKRIKSCDPFYKGPRKDTIRKGDLPPPNDDDQPAPRDFLRLFGQSQAPPTSSSSAPPTRPGTKRKGRSADSAKCRKAPPPKGDFKATTSGETLAEAPPPPPRPPQGRAAMFVRRPGESTRAFLERIDIESKNRITSCLRKERKSDRRKRYLEERKKKFKARKKGQDDPLVRDFDELKDKVKFGEVVHAPPQLSAKPRGVEKKSTSKKLALMSLVGAASKEAKSLQEARSQQEARSRRQEGRRQPPIIGGLKRQKDIEEERSKVIGHYRFLKRAKLTKN